MISSSDELELLIGKWVNELIRVAVFSTIRGSSGRTAVLYVEGTPRLKGDGFAVIGEGNSLAVFVLKDCQFGYIRFEDKPDLALADVIANEDWFQPSRYEEAILIRWTGGMTAVILTLKK